MSAMVTYRGLFGETFRVPADSLGRRRNFPLAEIAGRFDDDSDRSALGMFSFHRPYGEVRAFMERQAFWVARGNPLRPAPGRYCR